MILTVISAHISIDEVQKEYEDKYVHFFSRPLDFPGDLDHWNSTIYTTKSIARAVIIRKPSTLRLFRIIECNEPFEINVDGKSCTVTMFENSGLAENLAIYFKGENCTALYTGSFTRCRALLCDKLLHDYVFKGIDVMYVDSTAVRSLDPVSMYSASAEIVQIAKKYPDHQIVMCVPPFGYEDLIFSLAYTAKMKVFVEISHLLAFEKHQISDIFEQDSRKAEIIVREEEEEEVTLEMISMRFATKKIITLRILLCELPPKNYYENIGFFEVHWSPNPSLSEIYTLVNYINPKHVMEVDSMPKLPSFLFIKKENNNTNKTVAANTQIQGDLRFGQGGRSTPVSEIEELSAAESCRSSNNYRRKTRKVNHFQSQFELCAENNIAKLHKSTWKYYTLPKRMPRKAKTDHQKQPAVELNGSKDNDISNNVPSVSAFSSFHFPAENIKDQHEAINRSRISRENQGAHLISSTPIKGENANLDRSIIGSDTEDLTHEFPSISNFSSLSSSVENDLNLTNQVSVLNASTNPTAQSGKMGEISETDCANPVNFTRKKDAKDNQAKIVDANETTENQLSYELPSLSTFSSLSISSERSLMSDNLINEAVSRINISMSQLSQKSPENDKSKKIEKQTLHDKDKSEKITSKDNKNAHQEKSKNLDKNNSSYDTLSVSTFSSLSSSVESDFNISDQSNKMVSQTKDASKTGTGVESVQNGDKTGLENEEPARNTPKKGNQVNDLKANATKGNDRFSYELTSLQTAVERNSMWNDLINEVVSRIDISLFQSTDKSLNNVQSNQGEKVLNSGAKSIKSASEKNKEDHQEKTVVVSETTENQLSDELPSLSTTSERSHLWNSLINEAVSRINTSLSQRSQKSPENAKNKQTEQTNRQDEDKSEKNTSKDNEKAHQRKSSSSVNLDKNNSSYGILSVSTFSSLSSSFESDFNISDQINKMVSQTKDASKTGTGESVQNGDKTGIENEEPIRNTPKKGNQVNGIINTTKENHRLSYEVTSIPTAMKRNSMWNDLINEVVSQIDISLSQSTDQSYQGERVLNNGDKSIKNTLEKTKEGTPNKAVVCSNEFQQSHQSSVSIFSSLLSNDSSNSQLNDKTNKVMSQTRVKTKSKQNSTNRAPNRSKRRRQNADNTPSKQCNQKDWKHNDKPQKKVEIVRQTKTVNQFNGLNGDDICGSTFPSFNQVNKIISQLHVQKPHKIVGLSTGRTQELSQPRRRSADVRNKHVIKDHVTKPTSTSKKYGRIVFPDLEDDAQVVPNVSDATDSEATEEFRADNTSLPYDISISTFTSLSLSSLSDERPIPDRKMTKKKKQRKKMPKNQQTEGKSGTVTANHYGQPREVKERESTKPRSKQRILKKKNWVS